MSMRYPGGLIASSPVNAAYPSGVWTQAQTQPYAAQNVWMRDQFWPNTTLLLQGNGTNGAQNNTFLDLSTNNFTITRNGNTTQGSFTPYEANGYWSNFFDGSGDSLSRSVSSTSDGMYVDGSTYTVEAFIFPTAQSGYIYTVSQSNVGGFGYWVFDIVNSSLGLYVRATQSGAELGVRAGNVPLNTWSHVAASVSAGQARLFINGVQVGATTSVNSATFTPTSAGIGAITNGYTPEGFFSGYISNLRIVKGTALYTANFTPPASPLTAVSGTSFLTCQSNRFIDNSTNNFTLTRNGDTSVQAFQPFPGATTWSGSVLGGSGYFDGAGDYLTAPSTSGQFGAAEFTLEAWVYPISKVTTFPCIYGNYSSYTTGSLALFAGHNSGTNTKYQVAINGASFPVIQSTDNIVYNQWTHLAVVRNSSNVITLYVNGVANGTYTTSATLNGTTGSSWIGSTGDNLANGYFNGYISNLRIVTGTAVYTANFTPPTAPLTAITNTSLLTNFTNAGIFDSAMMNNLETVGNAQVSTSVVKYGTGSMYFDGSGDILSAPASQNFVFGGDLTVEGWVYINSSMASSRPDNLKIFIFAGWNTGNTPQFYVNGTTSTPGTGLGYYDGTNDYQVAVTIPKDQWVHLAYVRSGAVISGFVNGVRYTITSSYSSTIGSANTFVIGGNPNQVAAYYSYLNGNIDDLRITKGAARYIGNFTPPVARMPGQ
jgi:hypothetical protein